MLQAVEQELAIWLGPASAIGANSWLEIFAWMAALFAAGVAGISMRRQSFQSRATLLLNLYGRWEALAKERKKFSQFFHTTRQETLQKYADVSNKHQVAHLRKAFGEKVHQIQANDEALFSDFIEYLSFFEVLGTYVKNGYVPIRDVTQIYKGPILALELVFRDFIDIWQQRAHMPPGLLENALYLMRRTKCREDWWLFRRLL